MECNVGKEHEIPFLKRIEEGGKSKHGRSSERRVMASLGARLTPGSGAIRGQKSDGLLEKAGRLFRIEAKSTIHGTMALDLGWLVKICVEALQTGRTPVLTVSFVNPDGKSKSHGDWVMIPRHTFEELTDKPLDDSDK